MSTIGSKIGVRKGAVGRTLIGLEVGGVDVAALGQEHLMGDGKNSVEERRGGASSTNIMECWTMEVYSIGFIRGAADRRKLGVDKGAGPVLSDV